MYDKLNSYKLFHCISIIQYYITNENNRLADIYDRTSYFRIEKYKQKNDNKIVLDQIDF